MMKNTGRCRNMENISYEELLQLFNSDYIKLNERLNERNRLKLMEIGLNEFEPGTKQYNDIKTKLLFKLKEYNLTE